MTRDDRLIDLLTDWLEDQPESAPDQLLDSVLTDLQTVPQRARWLAALRRLPMFGSNSPRFSIAIVAVAVVAVVAIGVWGRQAPPVGPGVESSPTPATVVTLEPSPAPTAAPTPTQAAAPTPAPTSRQIVRDQEATALEPGTWSTADSFPVRVSFDVPAGWMGWYGARSTTVIFPEGEDPEEGTGLFFAIVSNVYADPCRFAEAGLLSPAVGPSVDDLAAALVALHEADVSTPTDVTVDGHRGKQLTITAPESFEGCSPSDPQYRIMRLPNGNTTWMEPGEMQRMSIIDVDGTRLVIAIWQLPDASLQQLAEAQQVFDSIRLEPRESSN